MQLPRLKEWRESRGLLQKELAFESGLSEFTITRIEGGDSIRPNTARKVADALGVSVADLIERPPVPLGEGPLLVKWAYRADPDVFRLRIRKAKSDEIRELGRDLVAEFYRVRTREELAEEGPKPEDRKVRAFSLAGILSEELVRRGEEPLERYVLALKRFSNAMSGVEVEEESARGEDVQEVGGEIQRRGELASLEWALTAPGAEFDSWVEAAGLHDILTLNYELSEAAAREPVGSDRHSFMLRRLNKVIDRFRDIGGPFTETEASARRRARQAQRDDEDAATEAG